MYSIVGVGVLSYYVGSGNQISGLDYQASLSVIFPAVLQCAEFVLAWSNFRKRNIWWKFLNVTWILVIHLANLKSPRRL